jgi:GDP-D-mannose dehydratase
VLGWQPTVTFEQLIAMMVDADLARLEKTPVVSASARHPVS